MDTLQSMRSFARVVELGSFSAAAREQGVSQPTISKTISALERRFGVRLLERSTTSLALTEEGKRLYARSVGIIAEYDDAVAEARGHTHQHSGLLRVNAPVGLGELRLNRLVLEFLAEFPGIEVELILNDRMIDLVEESVDLAMRLGGALPPNVIARQVATSPRVLVASPDYLGRNGAIDTPQALVEHECVRFAGLGSGGSLKFTNGTEAVTVETRGRYRVNSSLALRQCFIEGVGLGTAPAWLVQDLIDDGALVRLLESWDLPGQELHLVYPSRRYQPLRTKAFIQFMTRTIPDLPGFRRPS